MFFTSKKEIALGFYGPPNAGKCVTPDTEIVLHDGRIVSIGELFREYSEEIDFSEDKEVYVDIRKDNLIVPSLDPRSLKIVPKRASHIYAQKYNGKIIEIITRSGRKIKATPNHPLLRVSDEGVKFIRSGDLQIGNCIGITKSLSLISSLTIPQITTDVNFEINGKMIKAKSKFHNPKSITIPSYVDEDFVSFVAYVLSESHHGRNKIIFSNTDPLMLSHFQYLAKKLFNLDSILRINKNVPQIEVYSKTLNDWLSESVNMTPQLSGNKEIPSLLMGLSDNISSVLLRRLFDCEGYVPKTVRERGAEIEFSSKSRRFVEQVQILLNRFGIVGKFKKKEIKGQYYYRLLIGGSDNHRLFRDKIGFQLKKKSDRLDNLCEAGLKRNRFYLPIMNLLENIRKKENKTQGEFYLDSKHISRMVRDNRISYHRLGEMARKSNNEVIKTLAGSDNVWDDIISVTEKDYDGFVFDLTIEDNHTFIVSNGIIAHNTSLANRICKDWTGEEIGKVSKVAHETRSVQFKEEVEIKYKEKSLKFKLVDTPGIATKVDYEDFMKQKMKKKQAQRRAKEATQGIVEAIKWLDDMDAVIVVIDATENPYSQVNITIVGNLVARDIPVLVVANKVDLKKANIKKVEAAFPDYDVVGISAKYGKNMDEFYESVFNLAKKA